jgi:[ribosomal protein S18]-alanine N-acetyltransferase
MSAQLQFEAAAPQREPMQLADLEAVLAIENAVYEFPWTRGNFIDSLAAGYTAQVLRNADGSLTGYCVAMAGVQETHLLNLSIAPAWQHRGLARGLLDALVADGRARDDLCLWLEVRESNARAREVYRRYGFVQVGWRRGYYPAAAGQREDACILRLALEGSRDAVD